MQKDNLMLMYREILSVFIVGVIVFLLFQNNLSVTIYPICILFAFLVVIIVSGNIEINIGGILKIKKDTEEIKKEMANLKVLFTAKQSQHNSPRIYVTTTSGGTIEKYFDTSDETFDVTDATGETVFINATTKQVPLDT